MPFRYYRDHDLIAALLRYRMRPHLAALAPALEEIVMPPVDIQKLTANMQRANLLIDRAAAVSQKGDAILSAFEAHVAGADAHFDAVKAYDDQLAAMQQAMGNGGPPLTDDGSFRAPDPPQPPPPSSPPVTRPSSSFDHATGDTVR